MSHQLSVSARGQALERFAMASFDRIVIVTRKTALTELVERFNTVSQARFYLEQSVGAGAFTEYQAAHDAYQRAIETLERALPGGYRTHWIDRSFVPTYLFGPNDLVVALGQDGLVVNIAKYLNGQPVIALNPDPSRIDGLLLPFHVTCGGRAFGCVLNPRGDSIPWTEIRMARAELQDGQVLHAVNDLFIGQRTHISARYRITYRDHEESQISSGIIVSTGAGSTGWHRSVVLGARAIAKGAEQWTGEPRRSKKSRRERREEGVAATGAPPGGFSWDAPLLRFTVREPFPSRVSGTSIVEGEILEDESLGLLSQMPQNGVIFSDGVEEDYLGFNSGSVARIGLSEKRLRLVRDEYVH